MSLGQQCREISRLWPKRTVPPLAKDCEKNPTGCADNRWGEGRRTGTGRKRRQAHDNHRLGIAGMKGFTVCTVFALGPPESDRYRELPHGFFAGAAET